MHGFSLLKHTLEYTPVGVRVLFIADTHGVLFDKEREILKAGGYDYAFCLGDHGGELSEIASLATAPVFGICGNHDPKDIFEKTEGIEHVNAGAANLFGTDCLVLDGCPRYKYEPDDCERAQEEYDEIISNLPDGFLPKLCISHASPCSHGDNPAHAKVRALEKYLKKTAVPLVIHGHIHRSEEQLLFKRTRRICVYRFEAIDL